MSDQAISAPVNSSVQASAIVVPNYLRWHWLLILVGTSIAAKFGGSGFGSMVWLLVQARWVHKVTGKTKAYNLAFANVVVWAVMVVIGLYGSIFSSAFGWQEGSETLSTSSWVILTVMLVLLAADVVLYIVTVFALRKELEEAPFGMVLSGPMTFFFSAVYFQYHFNKWGFPGEAGGSPVVGAPPSTNTPVPEQQIQS